MNFSNKFLSLVLVLTLVVSASTVLLNLDKLNSLKYTSRATTDEGFISIVIDNRLSITTEDSPVINFGSCRLLGFDFNITSDGLKDTFDSCSSYQIRNISARNNGNRLANVYIKSDVVGARHGGTFLESQSNVSDIAFRVSNEGVSGNLGGCFGTLGPENYTSFYVAGEEYLVCEHLNSDAVGGENSVVANFEILIPGDVGVGFSEVLITFSAEEFLFD